jgi:hypothetical protein
MALHAHDATTDIKLAISGCPGLQQTREATEAIFLMMRHCFGIGIRRPEWKCDFERPIRQQIVLASPKVFRQHFIVKAEPRYGLVRHAGLEWPKARRI